MKFNSNSDHNNNEFPEITLNDISRKFRQILPQKEVKMKKFQWRKFTII